MDSGVERADLALVAYTGDGTLGGAIFLTSLQDMD
jgi:hypothetical protein